MPVAKLEVFEEASVRLAGFAKALAHPARICILRYLAGRGEVACMEIVAAVPLSQPACSRHINELRKAGLLKARTLGSNVFYRIEESALQQFCCGMNEALHPEPQPSAKPGAKPEAKPGAKPEAASASGAAPASDPGPAG